MKFENPSFNFFLNGRTHTRTHAHTHGRTSQKQYAPHFFKVGGIKIIIHCKRFTHTFEPGRQKTGLRGFRPGPTQTGLRSH